MGFTPKSKLPRLPREFYQGRAVVLWTHTFEDRATGWLTQDFHSWFREILIHACARHALACPVYVVMPDHIHLMGRGLSDRCVQLAATRFLRKHAKRGLGGAELQDRVHDPVLREEQRKRGAFVSACHYVCENPVRAGLVENWRTWPFLGAIVCGYPALDPRDETFWDDFWKIYGLIVETGPDVPALPSRATKPDL